MQTRVLGLMLLTSCYLPMAEPEASPARSTRQGTETAPQCSDLACTAAVSIRANSTGNNLSHVHSVKAEPSKPDTSTLGITIAIPATKLDCETVLLAVVGAKRALLGEHVVLEATARSPESAEEAGDQDDSNADEMPALRWASTDAEVTVIGPASAEVSCDALGIHTVSVELAPPAPCPATVRVQVECVEVTSEG